MDFLTLVDRVPHLADLICGPEVGDLHLDDLFALRRVSKRCAQVFESSVSTKTMRDLQASSLSRNWERNRPKKIALAGTYKYPD